MICPACGSENIDGSDRCENCLAPFRDLDVPRADSAEGLARSVMADTLTQLECDETIFVAPDTPAIEVAKRMKDARLGCALVLDGGKLAGIFTEHDVLLKMTTPLDAGVSGEIETPAIDMPFSDIPFEEIRDDEMLAAETATATNELLLKRIGDSEVAVRELMSRNPETLHEHESVAFALNKMSMGRYRHLPIERRDGSYIVASIRNVLKYIAQEDW